MAATYKDIQKMTGLSLSTISKYFNGGNVRPDNAEAIKRAASELDYRVNSFAQSLRTQKSKTVGVLLPDLTNTFHAQIISGVSLDLMHAGYGVIVGSFGESEESMDDAVEFLLSKMVDGLVVVPTAAGRLPVALQSASNGHPPVVVLDRTPSDDVDSVTVDNERAGLDVGRLLLAHGHRSIGILAGPQGLSSTSQRAAGVLSAFSEVGADVPDANVVHTALSVEQARQAAHGLLTRTDRPTSIFATNSELTVGAAIAIRELQLELPGDLSMVGFDNVDFARALPPGLDIVVQPVPEIAHAAAELLLARMEHAQDGQVAHRVLQCSMMRGASVGAPPLAARSVR